MGSFTRTPAGILNAHLFYGTQAVVFIEGGSCSYSFADVCANQSGDGSKDMHYWTSVFATMAPGLQARFRAVGSKATLLQIAGAIAGSPKMTAFVAMDGDVDCHAGSLINDSHAFYTWGYSWETDLASSATIAQAALSVCPVDKEACRSAAESQADTILEQFLGDAHWFIVADVLLLAGTSAGLFDRTIAEKYVSGRSSRTSVPAFDVRDLRTRLRQKNAARKAAGQTMPPASRVNVRRDCLGHLIARAAHQTLRVVTASHNGPDLGFDLGMSMLASAMRERWTSAHLAPLRIHHEAQFSRITSAPNSA